MAGGKVACCVSSNSCDFYIPSWENVFTVNSFLLIRARCALFKFSFIFLLFLDPCTTLHSPLFGGRRDTATRLDTEKGGSMKGNMQQKWMDISRMDINLTEMDIRVTELGIRVTENM